MRAPGYPDRTVDVLRRVLPCLNEISPANASTALDQPFRCYLLAVGPPKRNFLLAALFTCPNDSYPVTRKTFRRPRKADTIRVLAVEPSPETVPAVSPKNSLNDLTAREWLPETISVWNQRGLGAGHKDALIEREHPAPFSFTDVARLISFFTKRGGAVLDPFVGVGSTLKACALTERIGVGIELSPRYAKLAKKRLDVEISPEKSHWAKRQQVLTGDARKLIRTLPENSVDFIVTSPPYWNILHKKDHKANQERVANNLDTQYSNDERDLGNIADYGQFIQTLAELLGAGSVCLKPSKYMAVIVSDFRDKSKYVMFHADLANSLAEYGLHLRGLTVLYQRHKRIFPYGYPYAFVPNIHNQFILILQNEKK